MGKTAKKDKRSYLEVEIDNVLKTMLTMDPASEDYRVMTENLERLYKLKAVDANKKVSADTIALIAGNLLGLALIMWFEKTNVITTKALGFVLRGRV